MFALAIGRVGKPHRRCRPLARRPIIANIGPQPSGLRLAVARRQHRYRGVIGVQLACRPSRNDGALRPAGPATDCSHLPSPPASIVPVRRPSRAYISALAIEREMIGILRHQNVRQQTGTGQPTRNRPAGSRCLHDLLAMRAAQLRAHMANHLETLLARTPAPRKRLRPAGATAAAARA